MSPDAEKKLKSLIDTYVSLMTVIPSNMDPAHILGLEEVIEGIIGGQDIVFPDDSMHTKIKVACIKIFTMWALDEQYKKAEKEGTVSEISESHLKTLKENRTNLETMRVDITSSDVTYSMIKYRLQSYNLPHIADPVLCFILGCQGQTPGTILMMLIEVLNAIGEPVSADEPYYITPEDFARAFPMFEFTHVDGHPDSEADKKWDKAWEDQKLDDSKREYYKKRYPGIQFTTDNEIDIPAYWEGFVVR